MTNRSGKYPIIVSSPQSGFHQAASGSKNAYQNRTSSGKSGRRPIICLSFPCLTSSIAPDSGALQCRLCAKGVFRPKTPPRRRRPTRRQAHPEVRPRRTKDIITAGPLNYSSGPRRAAGRHSDLSAAKAEVLTCTPVQFDLRGDLILHYGHAGRSTGDTTAASTRPCFVVRSISNRRRAPAPPAFDWNSGTFEIDQHRRTDRLEDAGFVAAELASSNWF